MRWVMEGERSTPPDDKAIKGLVERMWGEPSARPTAAEVLTHLRGLTGAPPAAEGGVRAARGPDVMSRLIRWAI